MSKFGKLHETKVDHEIRMPPQTSKQIYKIHRSTVARYFILTL